MGGTPNPPNLPENVADVVAVASPRMGYELGASVRTDGVQLVARWEKASTKTLTMGLKAHAAWLLRHEDKTQIRADYADQQRRLEAGEKLRDGERRIDGKRCQTKRKFASVAPVVLRLPPANHRALRSIGDPELQAALAPRSAAACRGDGSRTLQRLGCQRVDGRRYVEGSDAVEQWSVPHRDWAAGVPVCRGVGGTPQ